MTTRQSRAPAGTGASRGEGMSMDTDGSQSTAPAPVTHLPTARAAWLRLVRAARDAETRDRIKAERRRIAEVQR